MAERSIPNGRNYLLDAWKDVGVTLAFATGNVITLITLRLVGHPNVWFQITLISSEVGFATGVVDHTVKVIWYRTFVGDFIRFLWKQVRKNGSNKGGPGSTQAQPARESQDVSGERAIGPPPDSSTHNLISSVPRSWRIPIIPGGHNARFKLTHPQPGSAGLLALSSLVVATIASVSVFLISSVYVLLTSIPIHPSSHPSSNGHALPGLLSILVLLILAGSIVALLGRVMSMFTQLLALGSVVVLIVIAILILVLIIIAH